MSETARLLRAARWLGAALVLVCSVLLGAQAFAHEDAGMLGCCALVSLALLFPVSHALAEGMESAWRMNIDSSLMPAIARDVLRLINRHLLQLSHWRDQENARRGAFDPAVETLFERGQLIEARKLAAEKLWVAHCSGNRQDERMYRRYMDVVDRMRRAA